MSTLSAATSVNVTNAVKTREKYAVAFAKDDRQWIRPHIRCGLRVKCYSILHRCPGWSAFLMISLPIPKVKVFHKNTK